MEMKVNEQDWRLFKERLPLWQENYMKRLNQEYIKLLSSEGDESEKFWRLERRIREDKMSSGVVVELTRSKMQLNLIALLKDKIIGWEDLEGFSEEFIEIIESWIKKF